MILWLGGFGLWGEKGYAKMNSKLFFSILGLGIAVLMMGGCGQQASVSKSTETDRIAPTTINNLAITGLSQKVALSWEANSESDLAYYKIYKAEEKIPGKSWTKGGYAFLSIVSSNEYQDNNVVDGTKYYYRVSAVDSSSNESSAVEKSATPLSYKYIKGWAANIYWGSLSITPFNDLLLGHISSGLGSSSEIAYLFGIESGEIRASIEVANGYCLVVDDENNLYSIGGDVYKYHFQGAVLSTWDATGISAPYNSVIFNGSILFVSEFNGIYQFSWSTGNVSKWASMPDDKFFSLYGIAADTNYVYVSDDYNNRVLKYDKYGNYILNWGKEGQGAGEFYGPHGLAVDISGNVYVADDFNNRVQKFDSSGNFITKWGGVGTEDGDISPVCVAVDSLGRVYVSDSSADKIKVFSQ